ncbi:MAG TPA: alpha/beta hydrolase-fold protein [Mycobacteriales bacterium]|nr:alpha/beta hydrolase-fold protein [Mycobacteriales bacterium]
MTTSNRARSTKLAINRLKETPGLDAAAVDEFLAARDVPIVEGSRVTFLYRGEADSVWLKHSVYGLPGDQELRRLRGTDLWYLVIDLPEGSRMEYKLDVVRGGHGELIDDPLNPLRSGNPIGSNSVCRAAGYEPPEWAEFDPDSRPGLLEQVVVPSRALRRDCVVTMYLPARFRRAASYPLLVVHDGSDYLRYAALGTVLDNLIHRTDMAPVVVALIDPVDRLVEYANHAAHAKFVTHELVHELETTYPLVGAREGRALMGSSFGAVAALSTAVRHPKAYQSLMLQSGSFAFTDIGNEHGGGPVFDPVVKFVNGYRDRPRKVADRVFLSCGMYEPLIYRNRSFVPLLQSTGMEVRYVESRDGHNWESWRDRLRDGLSWMFPGPHKLVYE